jgi:hypothetical protein
MTGRLLIFVLASGLLSAPAAAAGADEIPVYRAAYEVEYNGRHVADAEFSVTAQGDDRFVFASSTRARLLLRLAAPNPALEYSEFSLVGDEIRPLMFRFQDTSRSGEDNYSIEFDAASGEAIVAARDGTHTETLDAGVLDRGSLQVVIMRDLARCIEPDAYTLIDDEGIDTYNFERLEDERADTGLGEIATQRYRQHREGSSRATVIWAAPEYAYLPVRIEQWRNDELQTVLILDELEGLQPQPDSC